jgi:hypothetical protein
MVARTTVNLRTPFERIITKAGHEPWPRLFQNLRTSCETDCVEKYPPHVVAEWLGHSPKVAAQHYLISREHHFEHVVNGGAATAATSTETPADGPPPCDADCSALATHLATQQGSARDSVPSHETTEPAETTGVSAGSSEITPVPKTGLVAGTGTEQTAFHSGNQRGVSKCDAECDAISADRIELLARAVVLVAGMRIPEAAREAVQAWVAADRASRNGGLTKR